MDIEDNQNCTIILSTMHKQLRSWWDLIIQQKQATNSFIHVVDSKMFTPDNEQLFGTKWTKIHW